jgi:RNA polymerase sigma-70 factor (ECF subfamily)
VTRRSSQSESVDHSALQPEELALRAQAGDREAFNEIVRRFEPRLYNFLLQRVRVPDDAAELTQDALTRAWERIHDYAPSWRFSTWVFTIASRKAVSHHRKYGRIHTADDFDATESRAHSAPDEGEMALGMQLWRLAARELSNEQHTILWLRYAEDLSIAEIASVVSKSAVGVRVALFRARQALAAHLAVDLQAGDLQRLNDDGADPAPIPPVAGRVVGGVS